jgi:hypothetical protein
LLQSFRSQALIIRPAINPDTLLALFDVVGTHQYTLDPLLWNRQGRHTVDGLRRLLQQLLLSTNPHINRTAAPSFPATR